MDRLKLDVVIRLEQYIAEPYWPEIAQIVEIQTKSGMNRQKSDAKRDAAVKGYLAEHGMTWECYQDMIMRSKRKWYRVDNDDESSTIVIPRHQLAGTFVQAINLATAAVKKGYESDSFRAEVRISDFMTTKIAFDEIFDRYVKPNDPRQTMRRRTVSEVLKDVEAVGTIEIDPTKRIEDFRRLTEFALLKAGVGASRKMGYGRGEVIKMAPA